MIDPIDNLLNDYSLYEIKKGDTLDGIAQKLDLNFDDLRQFHNKWSTLEDCLAGELRSHLKFLKIRNQKPDKNIAQERKPQQTLFVGEDFILPFRPFELNNSYTVLYTIEKGETKQTIQQNFKVRRLKPDTNQSDYHFIQADKTSVLLINGKPAEKTAHKVAEKTAKLLFPLRIVVDKYGKWVDLNSYDKLKERWVKQESEIKEAYEGDVYEKIVENVEKIVKDNDTLVKHISTNWFLRAFFNGIHVAQTQKLEIEKKVSYPVMANQAELKFLVTQKTAPYLNALNQIEVTQNGESENEFIEAFYDAKYCLNPNNYNIESLKLECNLIMSVAHKITIEVNNLNKNRIDLDLISVLV